MDARDLKFEGAGHRRQQPLVRHSAIRVRDALKETIPNLFIVHPATGRIYPPPTHAKCDPIENVAQRIAATPIGWTGAMISR
jgi:hypothetical protein